MNRTRERLSLHRELSMAVYARTYRPFSNAATSPVPDPDGSSGGGTPEDRESDAVGAYLWIWLPVLIVVIIFMCKCCAWCAAQNTAEPAGATGAPRRTMSTVAIVDSEAPQSVTRAPAGDLTLDEYLASLERQQPPPYGSLPPPAYEEDPPPPYTSLDLQEINEHRTNFIDVGLITDTASTSSS